MDENEAAIDAAVRNLDLPNFAYLWFSAMLGLGMFVGEILRQIDAENPQSEN